VNWKQAKDIAKRTFARCKPSRPTSFPLVDGVLIIKGEGGETVVVYGRDAATLQNQLAILTDSVVIKRTDQETFAQAVLEHASAQGAKQRWVTAEGYTQLPDAMREELAIGEGRHVWFLRGSGRWEAWREDELDRMMGSEADLSSLGPFTDGRSPRWLAAEARCADAVRRGGDPDPVDLTIVAEEQAAWDAANPESRR
jgi:hypothetical protein